MSNIDKRLGLSALILFLAVSIGVAPLLGSLNEKGDFSLSLPLAKEAFLGTDKTIWSESPDFILVDKSSLKAVTPSSSFSPQILGVLVGGYELEDINRAVVEYIVEPGDSLWSLADKFNISLETILWANDLTKNSTLRPGQKLIILPVSGIVHHVKSGDTISEIAQKYKGQTEEILSFNNLSNEGDIFVGDILIVPGGKMPAVVSQLAKEWVPIANSYFICPISSPCRITQGLHWYNAVDFSRGKCGDTIYAAAAGTVQRVNLTTSVSRWAFGGAGNNITLLHPNGVVTTYGHINQSLVSPGQQVSQGQPIAFMGGQPGTPGAGLSTACHVHFGVSGARNPFQ